MVSAAARYKPAPLGVNEWSPWETNSTPVRFAASIASLISLLTTICTGISCQHEHLCVPNAALIKRQVVADQNHSPFIVDIFAGRFIVVNARNPSKHINREKVVVRFTGYFVS